MIKVRRRDGNSLLNFRFMNRLFTTTSLKLSAATVNPPLMRDGWRNTSRAGSFCRKKGKKVNEKRDEKIIVSYQIIKSISFVWV